MSLRVKDHNFGAINSPHLTWIWPDFTNLYWAYPRSKSLNFLSNFKIEVYGLSFGFMPSYLKIYSNWTWKLNFISLNSKIKIKTVGLSLDQIITIIPQERYKSQAEKWRSGCVLINSVFYRVTKAVFTARFISYAPCDITSWPMINGICCISYAAYRMLHRLIKLQAAGASQAGASCWSLESGHTATRYNFIWSISYGRNFRLENILMDICSKWLAETISNGPDYSVKHFSEVKYVAVIGLIILICKISG